MLFNLHSHSRALTVLATFLIAGGLFGCDMTQTAEKDKSVNPYNDITDTYGEAASAALKYASEQNPNDHQELEQQLAKGYRHWNDRNSAKSQDSFRDFPELHSVQQSVRKHISQSPHPKNGELKTISVDSLLSVVDLTPNQKERLETLFSVVEDTDSFSKIKSKLNRFDKKTVRQFDTEHRQVILQVSALMRAQTYFIANADPETNADLAFLATTDSIGSKNCTDSKSETHYGYGKGDCEPGPDGLRYDPIPLAENYINMGAVATATGTAALGGASGPWNSACGPFSPVCASVAGGGAGLAVGLSTYMNQIYDYRATVRRWCRKPCSEHHPDYHRACKR